MSAPTILINNPKHNEINPFTRLPPILLVIIKAKNISEKYSGGENIKAIFDKNGVKYINPIKPMKPPTKEAIALKINAYPAFPCLVIGYPSKVVATAEDSPGTFIKIEDILPPYILPRYILINNISALNTSKPNVKGSKIAIPFIDPKPGIAPAIVPSVTPIRHHKIISKFNSNSTFDNINSIWVIPSLTPCYFFLYKNTLGKIHSKPINKNYIYK